MAQKYPHLSRKQLPRQTYQELIKDEAPTTPDKTAMKKKIDRAMKKENSNNNVNIISDAEGLYKSYRTGTGLYKYGNTLYVSGTSGKNLMSDIFSDLVHIPFHILEDSERYKDADQMLKNSPEITHLVGHSLGSAVVKVLNKNYNDKYAENLYSAPIISFPHDENDDNHLSFRTPLDPVAMLDENSITVNQKTLNPHSYFNFFDQGKSEFNPNNNMEPIKKIM